MDTDLLDRLLRPLRSGPKTRRFPDEPPILAAAMRGLPEVDPSRCDATAACVSACPTGAITVADGRWIVDAGACIFCAACEAACPENAIDLGQRFGLSSHTRDGLRLATRIEGAR